MHLFAGAFVAGGGAGAWVAGAARHDDLILVWLVLVWKVVLVVRSCSNLSLIEKSEKTTTGEGLL
jgi:hypothetical protein